jgi:hypothetical protein
MKNCSSLKNRQIRICILHKIKNIPLKCIHRYWPFLDTFVTFVCLHLTFDNIWIWMLPFNPPSPKKYMELVYFNMDRLSFHINHFWDNNLTYIYFNIKRKKKLSLFSLYSTHKGEGQNAQHKDYTSNKDFYTLSPKKKYTILILSTRS